MTINYSFERILVPTADQSRKLFKYTFNFASRRQSYNKELKVEIKFESGREISKSVVSDSNVKVSSKKSSVLLSGPGDRITKSLKVHIYIYEAHQGDISLTSNSDKVELAGKEIESAKVDESKLPLGYSVLIASALHEELNPLIQDQHWDYVDEGKKTKTFRVGDINGNVHHILCYSSNKMGMAFNGVALTKIIEQYKPKYVLFIGTCAGFRSSKNLKHADVLIPEYIYEYTSGKHASKKFQVEYRHYDVSTALTTCVNDMLSKRFKSFNFNVKYSCGFCSGASVVSSSKMKKEIEDKANRKVLGFDMEAYVIAVINHLYSDVEAIVVKGIMDFGVKKNDKYKSKAIKNSTTVTNELIKYIVNNQHLKALV